MDRHVIIAAGVATTSVVVSFLRFDHARLAVLHAMSMIVPLALIAFPDAFDAAFGRLVRLVAKDANPATPAIMLQVSGWLLLVAIVATQHVGMPWSRGILQLNR
jgi:hypothetical protein